MGEDPIDMEYIRKEAFYFFKHHSVIDQWIGDGLVEEEVKQIDGGGEDSLVEPPLPDDTTVTLEV